MEILIVIGLVVWLVLAVRSIKKNGCGCGGDCSSCGSKCQNCSKRHGK